MFQTICAFWSLLQLFTSAQPQAIRKQMSVAEFQIILFSKNNTKQPTSCGVPALLQRIYLEVELLSHKYLDCFPRDYIKETRIRNVLVQKFLLIYILSRTCFFFFSKMASHWVLILHFPDHNRVVYCVLSSEKCLFMAFAHFLLCCLFSSALAESLYIFWILIFYQL